MRYHFTPARMAIINKSINKCWSGCGEKGMQTSAATAENSMEVPQKIKNGSAFGPSSPASGNMS